MKPGSDEPDELYVDSIKIVECEPRCGSDDRLEGAVLRSFLNVFNNYLYVVIKNSRDALRNRIAPPTSGQLTEILSAANELDSAVKRLQSLVEGPVRTVGKATILVVDDQSPVRNLVMRTLEGDGHTVLGASGGQEALTQCEAYPGTIHLVIADVGMEPIDGYELVRRIQIARPGVRAIYMSGNWPDHSRAMPGTEFLMKGDELARALPERVRHMLRSV